MHHITKTDHNGVKPPMISEKNKWRNNTYANPFLCRGGIHGTEIMELCI